MRDALQPGWVVTPKPVAPELEPGFEAAPYVEPEPPHDEWLEAHHRLSDADRAALSRVYGVANRILDNE